MMTNPETNPQRVIILLGPTAVGKSEIALRLAERLGAEILSADAMQVYRGMDIGTAKPSLEERRRVPHHLVDVVDPDTPFSAGEFLQRGEEALQGMRRRGVLPLVVGGTGLYIRVLRRGLFTGPGANPALREALFSQESAGGTGTLHRWLQRLDPEAAQRIHPRDLHRIVRALEVCLLQGCPLSTFQTWQGGQRQGYLFLVLGLLRDRTELYQRIDARVDAMLANGLETEVQGLVAMGYPDRLPAMRALGYRHVREYLGGLYPREEMVRRLKRDTRRYAKRQMTWFTHEPGVIWEDLSTGGGLPGKSREAAVRRLEKTVDRFLQEGIIPSKPMPDEVNGFAGVWQVSPRLYA